MLLVTSLVECISHWSWSSIQGSSVMFAVVQFVDFAFVLIGSEFLVVHSMRSHSASSYDGLNVVIHYWHHFQVHLILLHLTLNVA